MSRTSIYSSHDLAMWHSLVRKTHEVPRHRSMGRSIQLVLLRTLAFINPAFARNLTPALDVVNTTFSNVTSEKLSCRSNWGIELNWSSCNNAWEQIPRDSELHFYGLRADIAAGAHLDMGLPIRYLSEDGLCAIDIRAQRGARLVTGDSATNIEVSEAAKTVLDDCVQERGKGGSISGFSRREFLVIIITKYEPKAVCEPPPEEIPFVPFCEKVLQTMPARRQKDVFAFKKDPQEPAQYYNVLPRSFPFPATGPRCALTVSKNEQFRYSKSSWFEIWTAAVEVYTKCIQKGTSGSVHELGDNKQLYITLDAEGGPLALSSGCRKLGHCLVNATLLALDQKH